ncbi:MAG TPA: MBL fold metallo-hydrolase [Phototrophicaceae bacterium]|nr:MBL fold metallo-hydrolase [Phototrophicaceae bacterium]
MPETVLTQISPHVYWLPPGPPDRPSLCAVVGGDHTLLLDAGSSPTHVRPLVAGLAALGAPPLRYVALTHWHWDHVFGAAAVGVPVIAHRLTADRLAVMAGYDWNDAALEARVQAGTEIIGCASDIKIELPEPRQVTIAVPEIVFDTALELRLGGGITCRMQHVGGDHSPDSAVMFVEPDGVLFLGDCLCEGSGYEPARCYTRRRLYPLLETLYGFNPQLVVEGHLSTVTPRAEFDALAAKMRLAGRLVEQLGADEAAVLAAAQAQTGQMPDDELREIVQAFIIGRAFE